MLDSHTRDTAVRINALDVTAQAFALWHATRRGQLPPIHMVTEMLDALSDGERKELDTRISQLPDATHLASIIDTFSQLGSIRPLHAEDRRYIAEYRCWLIEAVDHLRLGEYPEALAKIDRAREQLYWLMFKRKRATNDYRWRSIDQSVINQLLAFIGQLDEILIAIRRAVGAVR
jgi:hypothetical protein